ncbi:hypothetical protein BCR33DRAFT_719532 [Rhizoclosmatium globosum]|uniref:BAG domain-containing protein n=1 Tax=Rhizoclosmatium globosum TaxID=329046 RepID=A0A1Y2BZE0_9FUNG|nr:hypothetical protein BCR33DRAFT_719532 [Rhizoclosmatium globosum]|eukprot:ORY40128.1 hypothetical protein BCR33DRAFT_719532 [Rhizoclosmatium globosum]
MSPKRSMSPSKSKLSKPTRLRSLFDGYDEAEARQLKRLQKRQTAQRLQQLLAEQQRQQIEKQQFNELLARIERQKKPKSRDSSDQIAATTRPKSRVPKTNTLQLSSTRSLALSRPNSVNKSPKKSPQKQLLPLSNKQQAASPRRKSSFFSLNNFGSSAQDFEDAMDEDFKNHHEAFNSMFEASSNEMDMHLKELNSLAESFHSEFFRDNWTSTLRSISRSLEVNPSTRKLVLGAKGNKPLLETEEKLTSFLLKLDSIESGGIPVVREQRKKLVNEVQSFLDDIEDLKKRAMALRI